MNIINKCTRFIFFEKIISLQKTNIIIIEIDAIEIFLTDFETPIGLIRDITKEKIATPKSENSKAELEIIVRRLYIKFNNSLKFFRILT